MPKARGPEIDEVLLDMEEDRWDIDSGIHEVFEFDVESTEDYVVDHSGVAHPMDDVLEFMAHEDCDCCDRVNPIIWPLATRLLKALKKNGRVDDEPDQDLEPPFF